jgi:CDP-glucose 4,6-dehydratase
MLKSQGHEVIGISLPPRERALYREANLKELFAKEHFIDIRDKDNFRKSIISAQADVAFHLAAQPLVRESYLNPIFTYETNVLGTLNFLAGIKESSVRAAIVVTTDKVYKNKNILRGYTESDELGGHDPYSSSKAAADIATQSWVASFDSKNIAIARAGNVIGGGDWSPDRLIPDLVRAFSTDNKAVIRYPDSIRPWQHVMDCLAGYLLLSDKILATGIAGEWNFGPAINTDTKVSKVADLVANLWGGEATWTVDEGSNQHEAGYLLLDSTKARQQLSWKDKLDFHNAIEWTVDFYKSAINGENPRALLEIQIEKYMAL